MGGMTLGTAGEIGFLAGKFDLAIDYCNEALAIDPNNGYAAAFKSFVIGFRGDWNTTIEMLTPIYEETPDFNYVIAFLGYAFAKSGQSAKARWIYFTTGRKPKKTWRSIPSSFSRIIVPGDRG